MHIIMEFQTKPHCTLTLVFPWSFLIRGPMSFSVPYCVWLWLEEDDLYVRDGPGDRRWHTVHRGIEGEAGKQT